MVIEQNAEYAGTRVGRWLRGTVRARRMFLIAPWCLVVSFYTWLPRELRGVMFITGIVLITWNLALDTWSARKRRKT